MKGVRISFLMVWACLLPAAWGQQPPTTNHANWTQFHRNNMSRFNRYETVLGVHNVNGSQLKWSYDTAAAWSPRRR